MLSVGCTTVIFEAQLVDDAELQAVRCQRKLLPRLRRLDDTYWTIPRCLLAFAGFSISKHIGCERRSRYTYLYIYIYVCVCLHLCLHLYIHSRMDLGKTVTILTDTSRHFRAYREDPSSMGFAHHVVKTFC